MKRAFLTVYDYGTGGVWAYIRAQSAEEIYAKFRDLYVYEASPPAWMSEAQQEKIRANGVYDVETVESHHPSFAMLLRRSN